MGYGTTKTELLIEAVLNILLICSAVFTFMRKPYGLWGLIILAFLRLFLTIPQNTAIDYSVYFGENMAHMFRDFGLFAIAMCFRKDGISGWHAILASKSWKDLHKRLIISKKQE